MTGKRTLRVAIRPVGGLAYPEAGGPWEAPRHIVIEAIVGRRDAGMAGGIVRRAVQRIAHGRTDGMAVDCVSS